eukprot:s1900_g4.t1
MVQRDMSGATEMTREQMIAMKEGLEAQIRAMGQPEDPKACLAGKFTQAAGYKGDVEEEPRKLETGQMYEVVANFVAVRKLPSLEAPFVRRLKKGAKVEMFEWDKTRRWRRVCIEAPVDAEMKPRAPNMTEAQKRWATAEPVWDSARGKWVDAAPKVEVLDSDSDAEDAVVRRDAWIMVHHPEMGLLLQAVQPGDLRETQLSDPAPNEPKPVKRQQDQQLPGQAAVPATAAFAVEKARFDFYWGNTPNAAPPPLQSQPVVQSHGPQILPAARQDADFTPQVPAEPALIAAVRSGDEESVRALLQTGHDPNIVDALGSPAAQLHGYRRLSPGALLLEAAEAEPTGRFALAMEHYCASRYGDKDVLLHDNDDLLGFLTSLADDFLAKRKVVPRLVRVTDDPFGGERLQQILEEFPHLKEELHDDVRPSLEAADAGDAEAALREVAANVFCENPSAAVLQKLKMLGRPSPYQDTDDALGVQGLRELCPELEAELRPCAWRLLGRSSAGHAKEALRIFRETATSDLDESAYLISLLTQHLRPRRKQSWVRDTGRPLGDDGLKKLLREFPQLQEMCESDVLAAVALTDAADAEAALRQVADAEGHRNPTRLLKGLLNSLNARSPLLDTSSSLGSEEAQKLLSKFPRLRGKLLPTAVRLLERADATHAEEVMDVLAASGDDKRNPSAFLVSLLSGSNAAWAKKTKTPLGAKGLGQLMARFPRLKVSFDDSFLGTLKFADASDAEAVCREVAQSDTENPTKYALGLLKALSSKGTWQDRGERFGRWRVEKLLKDSPDLEEKLGPCALRLLERTQADHARRCLSTLKAKADTLQKPRAWFTSLLRRKLVKEPGQVAAKRGTGGKQRRGPSPVEKVLDTEKTWIHWIRWALDFDSKAV